MNDELIDFLFGCSHSDNKGVNLLNAFDLINCNFFIKKITVNWATL